MKKILLSSSLIVVFSVSIFAKAHIITGNEAAKKVTNAVLVRYNDRSPLPNYVRFAKFRPLPAVKFNSWIQQFFKGNNETTFDLIKTTKDKIGFTHKKYQEKVNNIAIQFGQVTTHIKNGMIYSFSGELYPANVNTSTPSLTEQSALQKALNHIGAQKYQWQISGNNKALKIRLDNPNATFYPKGSLTYIYKDNNPSDQLRLAYKFNIYAAKPLSRTMVWVDAQTGEILFTEDLIWEINNSNGTAVTGYSGTQNIVTDSVSPSQFRLRETGRDAGVEIETFNLQTGTNYGAAVDFTDANNNWNNVNAQQDQYATDAHWGAEMTVDYYWQKHNRNSIDGNGMNVIGYVHYDVNYLNAFWDGTEMTYGDGSGSYTPLTTIDVAGHEMTHGVTGNTANLNYQDESGALNESFSDCFGNTIEHWAKPSGASWLIAEGMGGTPFRNMANPKQYQQPDTYLGQYWYTGTGDNGGVHTNSGVQNYWYYIMVEGDTGTNDNNDTYNVTGLGWDTAANITYRNLTVYLTANSQYSDSRFYAIQAAIDLYGGCTQAVETTTNAWYAVGVGSPYVAAVTSAFTSSDTSGCAIPYTVQFTNNSNNGISYYWDFGDGSNSTATNPSHTYTAYGNYTVKLVTNGGSCGMDSIIQTNYIVVDSANPCIAILPPSGSAATQTGCAGNVYDDGGPTGNYTDNSNSTVTISPTGASYVTLTVNSFNVESNGSGCYDYLYIYDGPSTASPLIGSYCSSNPPPTTIQSTSSSITLEFSSDLSVNYSGFDISWQCSMPITPPVAQFVASSTSSCNGTIQFTDQSTNAPTSWHWDFGDGDTSNVQNPTHTYTASGTYTVDLTATNSYGNNQVIQNNYIAINLPQTPVTTDDTVCISNPATLSATSGTGQIQWYADANGDTLLGTGNIYNTQPLNADSTLYVSDVITHPIQSLGPVDNTIGNGTNYQYNNSLIFDVYTPITLISVKVYAAAAVTRTIELMDNGGNVLQSLVANIPASATNGYVVTLNFNIQPGTGYELGLAEASAQLYRNSTGANYPYTLSGYANITGNTASATSYYYIFYDWKLRKQNCKTTPIAVTAHVKDCSADTGGNGIENYSLSKSVKIYPNPAGNTFNIAVNNTTEPIQISVYNEVGQMVLSSEITKSGITQLSTKSLAQGVYNIRLRGINSGKSAYKRLIIIK